MDTDGHRLNSKNTEFYLISQEQELDADEIEPSVFISVLLWPIVHSPRLHYNSNSDAASIAYVQRTCRA